MDPSATITARGMSERVSRESPTSTFKNAAELAGRILLSVLFLLSGLGKVGAYAATAAYMSSAGGLLLLVANGAGLLSLDRRLSAVTGVAGKQ